jgi:ubiquitin-protein ligase
VKTLKDFVSTRRVEETIEPEVLVTSEMDVEVLELEDLPSIVADLEEGATKKHPMDPPAVLIMHRKFVRQYPNNQRVALYYVDKVNKYVTVPYTAMQWSSSLEEETVLESLQRIVESNSSESILLEDGKKISVSVVTAKSVLEMYKPLNKENREMVTEMVKTKDGFNKVVNFAQSNLK